MILGQTSGLTWNVLPLFAALAAISGAGSLLVRGLKIGRNSATELKFVDSIEKFSKPAWGWSYVLGMAFVGIVWESLLAISGRISSVSLYAVLTACVAMSVVEFSIRWRINSTARDRDTHSNWWRSAFRHVSGWTAELPSAVRIITLLGIALFLWFSAIRPSITYDVRSIFGLKARILYDTGALDGEDFRNPDRLNFNANYPLLIPLVEATLLGAQGSQQNVGLQMLFVGFVLATASLLVEAIRGFESPAVAALWGAGFLLLPLTLAPTEGGGLSGSADYAMAAFTTAAALAAAHWLRAPTFRSALCMALPLCAAVFTKQEAVFWLIAIGLAVTAAKKLRNLQLTTASLSTAAVAALIVIAAIGISSWNARGIPASPYFRAFSGALRLEWIMNVWTRIPFILDFAGRELGFSKYFGLAWPFAVLTLLLLRRPKAPLEIVFYRVAVFAVAGAYSCVFVLTPLHLEYQLLTALFRLAVHFLPLLMVVTAEQLAANGWSGQIQQLFAEEKNDENAVEGIVKWQQPAEVARCAKAA